MGWAGVEVWAGVPDAEDRDFRPISSDFTLARRRLTGLSCPVGNSVVDTLWEGLRLQLGSYLTALRVTIATPNKICFKKSIRFIAHRKWACALFMHNACGEAFDRLIRYSQLIDSQGIANIQPHWHRLCTRMEASVATAGVGPRP